MQIFCIDFDAIHFRFGFRHFCDATIIDDEILFGKVNLLTFAGIATNLHEDRLFHGVVLLDDHLETGEILLLNVHHYWF